MRKKRKQKLLLLGILLPLLTGCSVSVATFTPTAQPQAVATTVSTSASTSESVLTASTSVLPTLAAASSAPASVTTTLIPTTTTSANSPTPTIPPTFTPVMAPTPTPELYNPPVSATIVTPTTTTLLPTTATSVATGGIAIPAVFTPGATPDAQEHQFIQLLNVYRQANGLNPLTFDAHLFQSSSWMAKDMATKNYVNHTDSLHRDIPTRIHAFGYPGPIVGENIAGGFANAEDNLKIWESDQIHKDNLLGKYYKHVGVARYYDANSLNKWYWVLDMGG